MTTTAGTLSGHARRTLNAETREGTATLESELDALERLAHNMDSLFRIPGTRIRIGLDTILGLFPGVGDTVTMLPTGYIIYKAHQLGVPKSKLARMGWNAAIDWVIGSIPLVGDVFDAGFKANRRNVALLRRHFEAQGFDAKQGDTA